MKMKVKPRRRKISHIPSSTDESVMTLISTEEKGLEARGHCTSMAITMPRPGAYTGSVASLLETTSIDTVYPLGLGSVASLETCLLDHAHLCCRRGRGVTVAGYAGIPCSDMPVI